MTDWITEDLIQRAVEKPEQTWDQTIAERELPNYESLLPAAHKPGGRYVRRS